MMIQMTQITRKAAPTFLKLTIVKSCALPKGFSFLVNGFPFPVLGQHPLLVSNLHNSGVEILSPGQLHHLVRNVQASHVVVSLVRRVFSKYYNDGLIICMLTLALSASATSPSPQPISRILAFWSPGTYS